MSDAATLLGLLADDERLAVVASLVLGARTTAGVREATGLSARSAGRALARLEDAGLVVAEGDGWVLDLTPLRSAARAAAAATAEDVPGGDAETVKVMRAFMKDGRFPTLPAARGKRRVILEHVVQAFEPGERYSEREVDAMLRAFHDDYAALRRYLVDEDLLDRDNGVYWRIGGHVEV